MPEQTTMLVQRYLDRIAGDERSETLVRELLAQSVRPEAIADSAIGAPASDSNSGLSVNSRRMLAAIEELPGDEREVFSLVRIQGLSHVETAEVLGVSTKTVQRRIHRSMLLLANALGDLRPQDPA